MRAQPVAIHRSDIKPSATTRYAYGR